MRERVLLRLTAKCRFLALAILALFLSSCQPTPIGPQPLTDADKQKMTEKREAFVKAFLAKDASAVAEFYTEDAILLPPNTEMVRGKTSIQEFQEAFFKGQESTELTLTPVEVFGVDYLAYEVGTYTLTMVPAGSDSPVSDTGKYVEALKKQADGSWKIAADIWNSDQPPPQQGESASGN